MLGIQRRSHVELYPSQRLKNEDLAEHPRGYNNRKHGHKYSKNIFNLG
jgi:hypothetical protein